MAHLLEKWTIGVAIKKRYMPASALLVPHGTPRVVRLNAALRGRYRVERAHGESGTVRGPRHLIRTPPLLGLLIVAALPACGDAPTANADPAVYSYQVPPDLGDGLGSADARSLGMTVSLLERMVRQIGDGTWPNIHAVLVFVDEDLVLEEYFPGVMRADSTYRTFDRDTLHDIYSVTKSFTATAVGLAIAAGAISGVDAPVLDFFPELVHLGGSLASGDLRVRHLLTMSAGLQWNELSLPYGHPDNIHTSMYASDDPVRFLFEQPQVAPPGEQFSYNTALSNTLGEIVSRATGEPYVDFLERELFDPLGIEEYRLLHYPSGVANSGGGLFLRPRDMLKLGVLYLESGTWQDRRIVPESWVTEATHSQGPSPTYGYQWWVGTGNFDGRSLRWFRALGLAGQHVFVFPGVELVVVFTSNDSGSAPYALVEDFIVPSIN